MSVEIGARGYVVIRDGDYRQYEHVVIAEKALGRKLPEGVEVHHVNEDKADNRPSNLVVCPNREYHNLLHTRQRALDACGNADWRSCHYCKEHDDTKNMSSIRKANLTFPSYYHKKCAASYQYARRNRA